MKEAKFVLIESCFSTQASDWDKLLTVLVSPAPSVRNNLPALLCDKKSKRYEIKIIDTDLKPFNLSLELTERIRRMYEKSYLFGKCEFKVGFLKDCQL